MEEDSYILNNFGGIKLLISEATMSRLFLSYYIKKPALLEPTLPDNSTQ
jgi:hypothetical protein